MIEGGLSPIGDPIIDMASPLISPALRTALKLDHRNIQRRAEKGAEALSIAIEATGLKADEFENRVANNDARLELVARILEAAARTVTLETKISALGRVLASGIRDDAGLDESLLLADAIRDLEAPHVRVLRFLRGDPETDPVPHGRNELLSEFTGLRIGIANILSTLTRHGLVLEHVASQSAVPLATIEAMINRLISERSKNPNREQQHVYDVVEPPHADDFLRLTSLDFTGEGNWAISNERTWIVSSLGERCLMLLSPAGIVGIPGGQHGSSIDSSVRSTWQPEADAN